MGSRFFTRLRMRHHWRDLKPRINSVSHSLHWAWHGILMVLDDETRCWLNIIAARFYPGSAAAWGSTRISFWPQPYLCLTPSRWPSILRQQQSFFGLHFSEKIFINCPDVTIRMCFFMLSVNNLKSTYILFQSLPQQLLLFIHYEFLSKGAKWLTLRNTELVIVYFNCNTKCSIRQLELNIFEYNYHASKYNFLKIKYSVSSKCDHYLIQI